MLGKLLKHEMKAMARLLLPIYLILAVLTVMDRIVLYLHIFKGVLVTIPVFITIAYVISVIAILMVSAVIIIIRFYRNLMTDEGYLMFTLPVKTHQLINSKLIASFIWTVTSIAAVTVSILIVVSGTYSFPEMWNSIKDAYAEATAEFGWLIPATIIEMLFMVIISVLNSILMIYVSIATGQLFNGHKVLGSFAAYIAINTVVQIVSTVGSFAISFIFGKSVVEFDAVPKVILPLIFLYITILTILYYAATNILFKKKLNL